MNLGTKKTTAQGKKLPKGWFCQENGSRNTIVSTARRGLGEKGVTNATKKVGELGGTLTKGEGKKRRVRVQGKEALREGKNLSKKGLEGQRGSRRVTKKNILKKKTTGDTKTQGKRV